MFPFATARPGKAEPDSASRARDAMLARASRLKDAGERLTASLVKGLQTMAGTKTTVDGMVAGFAASGVRAFVADHRPDTAVGAIELTDRGAAILVTLDAMLVHGLVELLCGGNGVEPPATTPRPVTPIDQQFAQIVVSLAAAAIQSEWAEFGAGAAKATKIDGPLAPDMFGGRTEDIGLLKLTIGIFGLHGTLRLAMPPAVLDLFAGDPPAEAEAPPGADPLWSGLLRREIERAPVALAAFLDANDISLGTLAGLAPGQILPLPVDARARAALMSDGRVLFRGEVGQDENRYSLRIDEVVDEAAAVARMASRRSSYFEVSRV